jgi:hypothetical protein
MACTPGGEERALFFPAPPAALAARFSAFLFFFFLPPLVSFSSSFFSPFVLLLLFTSSLPFSFFPSPPPFFYSPGRERGRPREITRPPWAPARPSRAQRSLLSQFANRAPGPRIVHLHFTIFRSEINTAPSAPHHDTSPRTRSFSLSCTQGARAFSSRAGSASGSVPAARPTDPENRRCVRRPCEISRERGN